MAKMIQYALFCLALFVVNSACGTCPAGKKTSFEQAACFMAAPGEHQDVKLSTLFKNIRHATFSSEEVYVEQSQCEDLDRKYCEFNSEYETTFLPETQQVRISTDQCTGDVGARCITFYDVFVFCSQSQKWSKATAIVPSTEAGIFYEAAGCNFFPYEESEEACPAITISESHQTVSDFYQSLVSVAATTEQQAKLQNAHLVYWVDDHRCVTETDNLQLPITEASIDYYNFYDCGDGLKAYIQLIYECNEEYHQSNIIEVDMNDMNLD